MALIKNGAFADDAWTLVADDETLPEGPAIVSLARFQAERDTLLARNGKLGIRLESGEEPKEIVGDLDRFEVIALDFPAFKNGRAFSYARLLRERYGYEGEIRATGHVVRDSLFFMARCGFDAFEVDARITPEVLSDAMGEFTHVYQPAADTRPWIQGLRHATANRVSAAAAE